MENDYYVLHITENENVFRTWQGKHLNFRLDKGCISEWLENKTSLFMVCYTHHFAMLWRAKQ
jgi:hypothetical protein